MDGRNHCDRITVSRTLFCLVNAFTIHIVRASWVRNGEQIKWTRKCWRICYRQSVSNAVGHSLSLWIWVMSFRTAEVTIFATKLSFSFMHSNISSIAWLRYRIKFYHINESPGTNIKSLARIRNALRQLRWCLCASATSLMPATIECSHSNTCTHSTVHISSSSSSSPSKQTSLHAERSFRWLLYSIAIQIMNIK